MLLLVLASFVFAVAGFFMAIHSPKGFHTVVGWISVVFFGLGGLYMLYGTLWERLTGKPFLTITDEAVIMDGRTSRCGDEAISFLNYSQKL